MALKKRKSEMPTHFAAWETKTMKPSVSFLVTKTTPKLFWIPGRHNEKTKSMLENRSDEVRRRQRARNRF
jgi:hypothetical protein